MQQLKINYNRATGKKVTYPKGKGTQLDLFEVSTVEHIKRSREAYTEVIETNYTTLIEQDYKEQQEKKTLDSLEDPTLF